jgi:pimeloyl-ACP methyl ester carboxylesterase
MTQPSRTAYALRSTEPTRLHVPSHKLPVIVVPDLFGTRLSEGDALVWNPHGAPFHDSASPSPGDFKLDVSRLARVSDPLEPDETHGFEREPDRAKVAHIAHYNNLVPEWYHALVTALGGVAGETADRADLRTEATRRYRVHVRVYCCGYDWRLDNARAALRLASVVDEALRETGAEKAVIVAHGMGGLVARYYCRCLGGEERVLRLVLIGSPSLGIPDAYSQLKAGLGGVYSRPYRDAIVALTTRKGGGGMFDADGRSVEDQAAQALVEEALQDAARATDAVIGAQSFEAWAERFFGGFYHMLCLGSGRALTREETRDWVRQMPAFYQLLPTATYCRIHKSWLTFSDGTTAYPPTGYMFITPSVMRTVDDLLSQLASADVAQAVLDRLRDTAAGRTTARDSTRAMRNADTVLTFFLRALDAALGVGLDDLLNRTKAAVPRLANIFKDCRSPRALYEDIYTGLLDVVEQRAPCAGRLALARRFDDALTNRPHDELPDRYRDLALRVVTAVRAQIGDSTALREIERREQVEREAREGELRPRVYMHPDTVAIYGDGSRCPHPGVLVPKLVISNDDSNVVLSRLMPDLTDLMGDGLVPTDSAAPPDDWLTVPLRGRHAISRVEHRALARDAGVIEHVKRAIEEVFPVVVGGAHAEASS